MQLVPTIPGLLKLATGDTSIGGSATNTLSGTLLKLVNNSTITLNQSTTWGSVSPFICGYTGYADDTVTFTAPTTPVSGGVSVVSNTGIFRPTDGVAPQNAWGCVLTDSPATQVLFAGPFDAPPIPMASNLDQIEITLVFNPAFATFICQVVA